MGLSNISFKPNPSFAYLGLLATIVSNYLVKVFCTFIKEMRTFLTGCGIRAVCLIITYHYGGPKHSTHYAKNIIWGLFCFSLTKNTNKLA